MFVRGETTQHVTGSMFAFYLPARLYLLRYTVHFNCLFSLPSSPCGVHVCVGVSGLCIIHGNYILYRTAYMCVCVCSRLGPRSPYLTRLNGCNRCSSCKRRGHVFNLRLHPESMQQQQQQCCLFCFLPFCLFVGCTMRVRRLPKGM